MNISSEKEACGEIIGILISWDYEVKSNKESGYGRYAHLKKCDSTIRNLMIIPKDVSRTGIIIEFKKIDYFLDDTIEEATKEALKQIEEKKYGTELLQKGVNHIIKLAIVFKGKEIKVTQSKE